MSVRAAQSLGEEKDCAKGKQCYRQQKQQAGPVKLRERLVELGSGDDDTGNEVKFGKRSKEKGLIGVTSIRLLVQGLWVVLLVDKLEDLGGKLLLLFRGAEGCGIREPEYSTGVEEKGVSGCVVGKVINCLCQLLRSQKSWQVCHGK
jgi:hypothetical protein